MKYIYVLICISFLSCSNSIKKGEVASSGNSDEGSLSSTNGGELLSPSRERVLGNLLKGVLENMHYSKKKINDKLSENGFKEFLKRLDFGKQFLLSTDVKDLSQYKDKIDDEMKSGQLTLLQKSSSILKKRQKAIQTYVFERLAKPFDLNKKFTYETDAENRKFAKDEVALKKRWDTLLHYDVLEKYTLLLEEQNPSKKVDDKKKKKKKTEPVKKLGHVELEKKSRESVKKTFTRIFKRLNNETPGDELDKFFNSVTRVYDPHTHYMIPDEKEEFDIEMSGQLEGIGALLREEDSHIKVERIIPGSASWRGKELKAEDVILKVGQGEAEPVSIVDMSLKEAVKLIRGKKGSEVRLTVKKPSGLIEIVSIIRDVVQIEDSYVKSTVISKKGDSKKYGYIFIPRFYRDFGNARSGRNCSDDTRKALKRLKAQNVSGVILDLRNNGGGALKDSKLITGLFIKNGPVVQVKASTGAVEVLTDTDDEIIYDKPLIVLINRFSASASEIVAAALQDYGRAIIVGGEHSHGKGTVQAVLDLDSYVPASAREMTPFGALKITIQKFYRVNGSSTQYKGVTPDIILPDLYGHMETGERYLDYSLKWQKVDPVKYSKWNKFTYPISKLRANSEKRVNGSAKFSKIKKNVNWFKKRKEEKVKSYDLNTYLAEKEMIKTKSEQLEIVEINSSILVQDLDKSSNEVDKEKFKEFSEELQKDPYIEETLAIFADIIP